MAVTLSSASSIEGRCFGKITGCRAERSQGGNRIAAVGDLENVWMDSAETAVPIARELLRRNRDPGFQEDYVDQLVARGHSYKEIGAELYIAEKTVENHVRNILGKLQLNRRHELIRFAVEHGIE